MARPVLGPARFGPGHHRREHLDQISKLLLFACLAILGLLFSERPPPSFGLADMHALCVPSAPDSRLAPAADPPAMMASGSKEAVTPANLPPEDLQEITIRRPRWVPERPAEQVSIAPEGQRTQDP